MPEASEVGEAAPELSVVLATRNRRERACAAVESVLQQDLGLEVIVVDDGSEDGTAEAIRERFPEVRLFRSSVAVGALAQRNRGARAASAPVVAFIEEECELVSPRTLRVALEALDDPRIGSVAVPHVDLVGSRPSLHSRAPDEQGIFVTDTYPGGASLHRRDAFLAVGGYRDDLIARVGERDHARRALGAGLAVRLTTAPEVIRHIDVHIETAPEMREAARAEMVAALRGLPLRAVPWPLAVSFGRAMRARQPKSALRGFAEGWWAWRASWCVREPIAPAQARVLRRLEVERLRRRFATRLGDIGGAMSAGSDAPVRRGPGTQARPAGPYGSLGRALRTRRAAAERLTRARSAPAQLVLAQRKERQRRDYEALAGRFEDRLRSMAHSERPEELTPLWQAYDSELRRDFDPAPPFDFLGLPVAREALVARGARALARQLGWLESRQESAVLRGLLEEDLVGGPALAVRRYATSHNAVQHLHHLESFDAATGGSWRASGSFLEFGGGYGGMARLVWRALEPPSTYVLVDTPLLCCLQWLYLGTIFGEDTVRLVASAGDEIEEGKISIVPAALAMEMEPRADLLISTWALSESPAAVQHAVAERDWFGARRLLLGFEASTGSSQPVVDLVRRAGATIQPADARAGQFYAFR